MNQKSTLIAAVALCSGTAFLAGRISNHPGDSSSTQSASSAVGPRASSGLHSRGDAPRGFRAAQSNARDRSPSARVTYSGNPAAHVASILNNPDSLKRSEEWLRFVKGLSADEMEEVVAQFRKEGLSRTNLSEYSMLLHRWTSLDPYAAMEYAENSDARGTFAMNAILSSWGTTDPQAAIRWAEARHEGEGANPWMVGVIRGVAANDPELASQLMNDMPYSAQRAQALNAVYVHYLSQGADAAQKWAMSISDERLRAGAISRIAEGLAKTDPKGTADWLVANPGDAATSAMDKVMEQMTLADSQSAISYLNTISDPTLKSRALEGIANELSSMDPYATLSMIQAHPDLVRDDIVRELIWGARTKEPVLGADAIARIQDERIRDRTYYRYIGQWVQNDLEAAANWVSQNELPPSIRDSVSRMIERRQGMGRMVEPGP